MNTDAKILIKFLPTKSKNTSERSFTKSSRLHPRDVGMVQYTKIHQHKNHTLHKQAQNTHTHTHTHTHMIISLDTKKAFDKIQHPYILFCQVQCVWVYVEDLDPLEFELCTQRKVWVDLHSFFSLLTAI